MTPREPQAGVWDHRATHIPVHTYVYGHTYTWHGQAHTIPPRSGGVVPGTKGRLQGAASAWGRGVHSPYIRVAGYTILWRGGACPL